MLWQKNSTLRTAAFIGLAGLSLTACATREYVDTQVSGATTRIEALEARVNEVATRADGAATEARTANQRIDQMEGRVTRLEQAPARRPRG